MDQKTSSVGSTLASVVAIVAVVIAISAIALLGGKNKSPVSESDSVLGGVSTEAETLTPLNESRDDSQMKMEDVQLEGGESQPNPVTGILPSGTILAGSTTPFVDFNQTDYKAALDSGQKVVLYFYANWCPTCKKELRDSTSPAFDEILGVNNVIGFRVSFNDNETSDFERDLAKQFGVAYQHTKVFLDGSGQRILKSPESWSKVDYIEKITNLSNS